MIRVLIDVLALAAAFIAGGFFEPKVATWFKSWTAARAIATAKKVVADAEAAATKLEAAKKVVAANPTPVAKPTTPAPTGATGT
jgi:hypothetical protein